jgi:hypothetical protein
MMFGSPTVDLRNLDLPTAIFGGSLAHVSAGMGVLGSPEVFVGSAHQERHSVSDGLVEVSEADEVMLDELDEQRPHALDSVALAPGPSPRFWEATSSGLFASSSASTGSSVGCPTCSGIGLGRASKTVTNVIGAAVAAAMKIAVSTARARAVKAAQDSADAYCEQKSDDCDQCHSKRCVMIYVRRKYIVRIRAVLHIQGQYPLESLKHSMQTELPPTTVVLVGNTDPGDVAATARRLEQPTDSLVDSWPAANATGRAVKTLDRVRRTVSVTATAEAQAGCSGKCYRS